MKSELPERLPRHIAFIMDGNGRWAKKRLMPRSYGHKAGVETMRRTAIDVFDAGIPYMSVYAFSTENKDRPKDEVDGLFDLIRNKLEALLKDILARNVRVTFMGELDFFPEDIRTLLKRVEKDSAEGDRGIMNIGLNYGSRDEITHAAKALAAAGREITAESLSEAMYTSALPDPDMIVRTGGEYRLSNFMLYQAAYSELFFTKTLWPDFDKKELYALLNDYASRNRRYGKV